MNRKMTVIGISAVLVIVIIAIGILAVQRGGIAMIFTEPEKKLATEMIESDMIASGRELMATTGTEEEAKEIAEMYGITFVKFADGIAEYTTDRPIKEVIAEGGKNGYPQLSVNYTRKPTNYERGQQ